MDLIITILPVITKDLPISPRFTPYNVLIAMQVQHSYNSSTNGYLLTFPRFPLRKKEHKSYFGKDRTHDFRTSRCAAYLLLIDHSGDEQYILYTIYILYSIFFSLFLFSFLSFISLIADGPHHYHPACGHKGSSHLSPVHALYFFLSRCKFSTLTTRQPMVEFCLLAFPRFYERKNTNPTLVRIELTTSALLAGVQVNY